MVFLAPIFLCLQLALGSLLAGFLDPDALFSRAERYLMSIVLGTSATVLALLVFLLTTRSWTLSLGLLWALLLISALVLYRKSLHRNPLRGYSLPRLSAVLSPASLVLLALFLLYLGVVLGVLIFNEKGLPTAVLIGWGDTALHLDIIEYLKTSNPFMLQHPVAAGESLSYPFLVDLLSSAYERLGVPKPLAWHIPVLLFGGSFFFVIFLIGKRVLKNMSLSLALTAIVFFGAGIGFLWFFQDLSIAWNANGFHGLISTLQHLPHEYSHLDNRSSGKPFGFAATANIVWIVPAISFLSHQRSFVSGASLAVILILGYLKYKGTRNMWRWGGVWGMIPLFHPHSFAACTIILLAWFFYDLKNWWVWLKGAALGLLVALPEIFILNPPMLHGTHGTSIIKPWLWWMSCTHHNKWYACDPGIKGIDTIPPWFWTKNFGLVFWGWIAAMVYYFAASKKRRLEFSTAVKPFLVPSLLLFLIPNLLLLQPWEFDNNKILYYWWIFAALISLALLKSLFEKRRVFPLVLALFVTISTLSGTIDVLSRIHNFTANHYSYYGEREIVTARWIRENTSPSDAFLTGTNHTQFVPMLTGRPIFLGYGGWLWSAGKGALLN